MRDEVLEQVPSMHSQQLLQTATIVQVASLADHESACWSLHHPRPCCHRWRSDGPILADLAALGDHEGHAGRPGIAPLGLEVSRAPQRKIGLRKGEKLLIPQLYPLEWYP